MRETKIGAVQFGPHAAQPNREIQMPIIHIPTDVIHLSNSPITTGGGNSAGNGAAGTNNAPITDNAHIDFHPVNTATADVTTTAGDHHVHQDVSVDPTAAQQTNMVYADQSQNVYAGVGGSGGNDNAAFSGDVHLHA
jgi:hypothetical protein